MVGRIAGQRMHLWRAIDDEGEVLDVLVQKRRKRGAAAKLLRKLLKNSDVRPETITTDKLASYRASLRDLGLTEQHPPDVQLRSRRSTTARLSAGSFHALPTHGRSMSLPQVRRQRLAALRDRPVDAIVLGGNGMPSASGSPGGGSDWPRR